MAPVLLFAWPGSAQQKAAINIVNERLQEVRIGVFDQVCGSLVYQGTLVHEAQTTIDCCTDASGRCKLTLEDQTGHRQEFDGVPGTVFLRPR